MQEKKMYLVGGAVRDCILRRPSHDNDWVVVGYTVEEMDSKGWDKVGAHFPVYLNERNEEVAMARTEVSTGDGYNDFKVDFNPNVTIEEDLYRRDFTINAIAYDENTKSYIDPYGGIRDLVGKTIRMVNPMAFRDDPLRVVRAIRFAIRYGFEIEMETYNEIIKMVRSGKLSHIPRERMFLELTKIYDDGKFNEFYDFIREDDIMEAFGFSEYNSGCDVYGASLQYHLCTLCETRSDFEDLDKIYKIPNEFKTFADVWYHKGTPFEILMSCRAEQDTPMLAIALELGMVDEEQVKAYRSVSSKDFPGITGKALGACIKTARAGRVDGLYQKRLEAHKQRNRYDGCSWARTVKEVGYE